MTTNQGYAYRHVLGPSAVGHTVHSFLVDNFTHSTATEWLARCEAGEIFVDGERADASESVRPGQVLLWQRPGWVENETPRTYGVIHRDAHLLVVDKPSGLPTLPGAGFLLNTLLSLVRKDFPDARPLHRLGRATSGIVLFALDTATASALHRSWPSVTKQYLALASGVARDDVYDIRSPIGPLAHARVGDVHGASPTGKTARSVARVVERRADATLFEVDLHTGRPHQIRIHLAFIGHPLVGDPLYTVGGVPREDQPGLPGDSGYHLHARRVALVHPATGRAIEFSSPIPEALKAVSSSPAE